MDLKKLLKVNIINVVILALIVLFYMVSTSIFGDSKSMGMFNTVRIITVVMGLAWAAYAIYSNVITVKESDVTDIANVKNRLIHAGNKRFFVKERTHMLNMLDSLENRRKYFMALERDNKLRELFLMTRSQMIRNVTNVSEYIETFDYISGVDSGYIKEIGEQSQDLLNRFNKLVELSVTYDDTTLDYDTREIDDMIEALEEMKKTGKATLES